MATKDFVGLNYGVYDPCETDSGSFGVGTNTLGFKQETKSSYWYNNVGPLIGPAGAVNAINIHRNGPYGFPIFKQIRIGENHLTRHQRKNNILTISKRPEQREIVVNGKILRVSEKFGDIVRFVEPPVISSYYPLIYNIGHYIGSDDEKYLETFGLSFDYGNNITFFTNEELNELLFLDDLKDPTYEEIKKLYLNGALASPDSEISYFEFLRYKETIYPRQINAFRSHVRNRINFNNNFWRDSISDREQLNTSNGFEASGIKQSIWALDTDPNWRTRNIVVTEGAIGDSLSNTGFRYTNYPHIGLDNNPGGGILQNRYVHFKRQFFTSSVDEIGNYVSTGPSYIRLHTINETSGTVLSNGTTASFDSGWPALSHSVVSPFTWRTDIRNGTVPCGPIYQGDTFWDVGRQADRNPAYDTYSAFAEDLSGLGKDFTIVPEFRMSERLSQLLVNPLSPINDLFEIQGGLVGSSGSQDDDFYQTYSTTDFLRFFAEIKEDHAGFVNPSMIKLKCKAVKKFLAYDGFYPAERTVQITEKFDEVFGQSNDRITINGNSSYSKQGLYNALFAPGVLYNTIKSGIAVDYPVYTSDLTNRASTTTLNGSLFEKDFTTKIPFDALLDPNFQLNGKEIQNINPEKPGYHEINDAVATGSEGVIEYSRFREINNQFEYTNMAHNFFAETVDFFLKDGELSFLASAPQSDPNFGNVAASAYYGMRVKMFRTYRRANKKESVTINNYTYSPPQMEGPKTSGSTLGIEHTWDMYSRPSAFGPPVAGFNDGTDHYDSRDGFNPCFTPPYYDGEAWIDFIYVPGSNGKVSLTEILNNITASYMRIDPLMHSSSHNNPGYGILRTTSSFADFDFDVNSSDHYAARYYGNGFGDSTTNKYGLAISASVPVNTNSMQLNASLNWNTVGTIKNVFDELLNRNVISTTGTDEDDPDARWIIQTQFETPILNFEGQHVNVGNTITASSNQPNGQSAIGMWHQEGKLLELNDGLFLTIDEIPDNWRNAHGIDSLIGREYRSLRAMMNFTRRSDKIGKIRENKVIQEAVVAIPYIEDNQIKKFFSINEENYESALKYIEVGDLISQNIDPSSVGLQSQDYYAKRAGRSIVEQIQKMKKYVFPPTFDFINYETVKPISMYIFEFEAKLDQQDLANIWQNIAPDIGVSIEYSESTIEHPLLASELLGTGVGSDESPIGADLNEKLRWMVFKVKWRGKNNYFNKQTSRRGVIQDEGNSRFTDGGSESLVASNWPWDYFSLVELVKIDAEVEFSDTQYDTTLASTEFEADTTTTAAEASTAVTSTSRINQASQDSPGLRKKRASLSPKKPISKQKAKQIGQSLSKRRKKKNRS